MRYLYRGYKAQLKNEILTAQKIFFNNYTPVEKTLKKFFFDLKNKIKLENSFY
jgi:hypothetical protein